MNITLEFWQGKKTKVLITVVSVVSGKVPREQQKHILLSKGGVGCQTPWRSDMFACIVCHVAGCHNKYSPYVKYVLVEVMFDVIISNVRNSNSGGRSSQCNSGNKAILNGD